MNHFKVLVGGSEVVTLTTEKTKADFIAFFEAPDQNTARADWVAKKTEWKQKAELVFKRVDTGNDNAINASEWNAFYGTTDAPQFTAFGVTDDKLNLDNFMMYFRGHTDKW